MYGLKRLRRIRKIYFIIYLPSSRLEVFSKKVFLEISQSSQENTCASLLFNTVAV